MKYLVLIGIFFNSFVFGQVICCEKIDSVNVKYLPWKQHSKFNITEEDFNSNKNYFKKKNIKDTVALKSLSDINLFQSKDKLLVSNIDIRMIIYVYRNNYVSTIKIDANKLFYVSFNNGYLLTRDFLNWIDANIESKK